MIFEEFILAFREQFVLLEEHEVVDANTEFKKLNGYDSLTALLIISMIDEKYNVSIGGDVIRSCNTLQDLFDFVNSKVSN